MSGGFGNFGVRPEQGPPLSIPLSFFLLAPLAVLAAGVLVLGHDDVFSMRHLPWTMALVHLGTLGFLGSVMFGALYQMLAVVASPVPWVRLGHLVQLLFVVGTVSLLWALYVDPTKFGMAWHSLATATALFLVPVCIALARARAKTSTVLGIGLAVLGLVVLGAVMARVRARFTITGDWLTLVYAHLCIGATVWIGGLLTSVSWQVIPMFYLTDPYSRSSRILILGGIALTLVGVVLVAVLGGSATFVVWSVMPGAFAVWVVHPLVTLHLLRGRKRKRADDSVRFWQAGVTCGLLVFALAMLTIVSDNLRVPVLLGWTLLWGWAGLIFHGMLSRIVPFLVWFHRYAAVVGFTPVPPMRQLWPKRILRISLLAHLATFIVGAIAIASASTLLTAATGVGLVITGLAVASGLLRVVWHLRS